MNKAVELPIVKPLYGTYQNHGAGSAVLKSNPSIRNWYLNQVMILQCNRKFINGFTTPNIDIPQAWWHNQPYLEQKRYEMQYLSGYVNPVIRELLSDGYYVAFEGVDDFYVPGKSWYKERHACHDGLICGYDQNDKTYSLFSYDSNWIYRVFKTPQKGWNAGRKAILNEGTYGSFICGLKPKDDEVLLEPETILIKLREYLDSSLEKYPVTEDDMVEGIAVHEYIAMYVGKLIDGSIPYERMDRRVFRLIWEHKVVMAERLQKVEDALEMDHSISDRYLPLVEEANTMRMLYASYHMKRRDSLLPVIQKKLLRLKGTEEILLTEFVKNVGGILKK